MGDLEDVIYNDTFDEYFDDYDFFPTSYYIEAVAFLTIILINVLVCILTLYSVIGFKKMRIRRNLLIAYWTVFTLLCNVTNPEVIMNFIILFEPTLSKEHFCLTHLQYSGLKLGAATSMFYLSLNCFIDGVSDIKFKRIAIITSSILVFDILLHSSLCYVKNMMFFVFGFNLLVLCIVLLMLIIRCCIYLWCKMKKNVTKDEDLRMAIVALFILHCCIEVVDLTLQTPFGNSIFRHFFMFILYVNTMHPLLNVILLIQMDHNYKLYFWNVLKCKVNYIEASVNYKKGAHDECSLQDHEEVAETEFA